MARPLTRRPRQRPAADDPADERSVPASDPSDLAAIVGGNLRRLRVRRGLSLERLAQLSHVSRAMLSQIELHQSTPTINVVWRIAGALGVPISALISARESGSTAVLRAADSKVLSSSGGAFRSRALFPFDTRRHVEFYELSLAPGAVENAHPHAPGTVENLVVAEGQIEVEIAGATHVLERGDAVLFEADVVHSYRNTSGAAAVAYLVMTYAEEVG